MPVTGKSYILISFPSYHPVKKNGGRFGRTLARKKDFQENIKTKQQPISPLRISKSNLARTAVAVFGLGFIDAGYSGDWSRIGVITPESEELLKIAAFVVVPLCVFLIFSVPEEPNS